MMTRSSPFDDRRSGYVVRKPRESDAVGGSLRNIYETEPTVPEDLAALLRKIDGHSSH